MTIDFDDIESMLSKEPLKKSAIKEVNSAVPAVSQIANSNDIITTVSGISRLAHTIDAIIDTKSTAPIANKYVNDKPILRLEDIEDFVNGDDKPKELDSDKEKDDESDKKEEKKEEGLKKDEAALEEQEKSKDQLDIERDIDDKGEKIDSNDNEDKEIADKEEVEELEEKGEDNNSDEPSDNEETEEKKSETGDTDKEDEKASESDENEDDDNDDSSEDEEEEDIEGSDSEEESNDEEQEDEDENSEEESENDESEEDEVEEEGYEIAEDEETEIEESDNEESQESETDDFAFDDKEEVDKSEEPEEIDQQDADIEEESENDNEELQKADTEEKPDDTEELEETDEEKDDSEDPKEPDEIEENNDEQESDDESDDEDTEDSDEESDDEEDESENEEPEESGQEENSDEEDGNDDLEEEDRKSEPDDEEDDPEPEDSDSISEDESYEVNIDEFVIFNQDTPDIDVVEIADEIDIGSNDIPDINIEEKIPHEIVSPSQVKDIANLAAGKTNIAELGKEKVVQEIKSVTANAVASATGIPTPVIEAIMESAPKALGITAPMIFPVFGLNSAFDKSEDMVILDSEHIPSQDRFTQELDTAVNEYCEAASECEIGDIDYSDEGYDDSFMADVIDNPSHYDMSQQGFDNTIEDENVIDFSIEEGPALTEAENAVDPFEYDVPQPELVYEEPDIIETDDIEGDSTDAHENWVDVVADVWGWFEEKIFDTPEDEQWSEYWRDSMHSDFDDNLFKVEEYFWFGTEQTSTFKQGYGLKSLEDAQRTLTSIKEMNVDSDAELPEQEKAADSEQELLAYDGSADADLMDNMTDGQGAELEILRENEAREQEQMQLREIERMVNSLSFDISSDLTNQVIWDMDRISADLFDEPADTGDIEDLGMDKENAAIIA